IAKEGHLSTPNAATAATGLDTPPAEPLLSVVVPAFNEEAGLERLFQRLRPALEALGMAWGVIVVGDGSSDGTRDKLKNLNRADPRIKGLVLSRHFRKESAMAAGPRS